MLTQSCTPTVDFKEETLASETVWFIKEREGVKAVASELIDNSKTQLFWSNRIDAESYCRAHFKRSKIDSVKLPVFIFRTLERAAAREQLVALNSDSDSKMEEYVPEEIQDLLVEAMSVEKRTHYFEIYGF